MNVSMLTRIAEIIGKHPKQFNMEHWHWEKAKPDAMTIASGELESPRSCGTTHCIAGWAQVLDNPTSNEWARIEAAEILGLDPKQATRLFYADGWPKQFRGTKNAWRMTTAKAVARIHHFIATNGTE